MNDPDDPFVWVEYAEQDFVAARSLLRRKKPLVSIACFHAQQCAEKYLKSLLIARKRDFPKTHDLQKLSDLCSSEGILIPIDADLLDSLSYFAAQTRYPGDILTMEDAQESFKIARIVRRFARKFLGLR